MPKKKETEIVGPGGVPIVPLQPSYTLANAVQLWKGAPKVGKTSTAAALGEVAKANGIEDINPFFLQFEQGTGGVEIQGTSQKCKCGGKRGCDLCGGTGVRRLILSDLEEIEKWVEWAAKSPFNPIILDTVDAMYQAVADGICLRLGITSPTQTDHGIAWMDIYDEMRALLGELVSSGKGLVMIMHIYMQERRVKGGVVQTAVFNVSGKTRPFIAGMANQILHFDVIPDGEGDKHVIIAEAKTGVEAGDQWGVFPEELDLGDSPESGAEAILRCFYEF